MSRRRRPGSVHRRHRFPRPALWVAGGFAAATVAWVVVAVPALVRYPTDVDVTQRFEGTFTVLVDPVTAAPLDEPVVLDLTVERDVEALGAESGARHVVVRETIRQQAGELIDLTQVNQYVMDRSTVANVADDRAFAFDPDTVVDRSGAYRLHLPFGTSQDETYAVYGNEIDATYEISADPDQPTGRLEGLDVAYFVADETEVPMTEAYLDELRQAVPLPAQLTLAQVRPHLQAAGVDLDGLLADLAAVLAPDDLQTLLALAGEPIGLQYVQSFSGRLAVEPTTGTEVEVVVEEAVGARPELPSLPELLIVLGRYYDEPVAREAVEALTLLADGPAIPLFEYAYDQTPASVAEIAAEAASMRRLVLAVTTWVPIGLGGLAGLALLAGAVVQLRRRPRHLDLRTLWDTPAPPDPHELTEAAPERPRREADPGPR